ncbi:MAG: tungstate ABC transporter substrate-binding protein WtpA [Candidatus Bathyarchaeum sp.]|nr:MAG: tungstate ABC transporter substrate-binding protein WtpA [Candidatus Bathyarchaeum sp.]
MRKIYLAIAVFLVVLLVSIPIFSHFLETEETESRVLKIYVAGSLVLPMDSVEEAFEESYPHVDVQIEGHGSIQVIRHVTELEEEIDLLMVADYSLIPTMAYKTTADSESFADWYIRFAGNSIVLAYTDNSRYSDEVTSENWCEILKRSDVKFGFPDPLIDALGYRSPMIVQLAENYYQDDTLFNDLITVNFDPAFYAVDLDDQTVIVVPELLNPDTEKIALRASSVQLVPLLESGGIDYCFLYRSNAEQYGVKYVELPVEVNLSSPEYEDVYQQVQIKFEHQRFGSVGLIREGKTIYYGLTIPDNAPNRDLAVDMVEFLLSGEGKNIFNSMQHPVYEPAFTDNLSALPQELAVLVEDESYN